MSFRWHFSVKVGAAKLKWVVQQKGNDTKMPPKCLQNALKHSEMLQNTPFILNFKCFLLHLQFWNFIFSLLFVILWKFTGFFHPIDKSIML